MNLKSYCEETDELKSQIDTVSKQSNKELVEKYSKLKDEGKHDTATQTDLVCAMYSYH